MVDIENIIKNNMGRIRILGTGLTGLVGSRVVELLKDKYEFENISLSEGIDITKKDEVIEKVQTSSASILIHFAAKTDVDGCEKDKINGENAEVWKVNVLGTKNIVEACIKSGKKLIHVSTDFVFDGINCPEDGYDEKDVANPISWYGKTKYEAEKIVERAAIPWIIIRLAYPYRANFKKKDFIQLIYARLKNNEPVKAVFDTILTPTFIDDVAYGLDILINKNVEGIYHIVGSQFVSPYEAAILVARAFKLNQELISKISYEEYFRDRAKRPFKAALKNDKIKKLGIMMKTFEEGLQEIKKQSIF